MSSYLTVLGVCAGIAVLAVAAGAQRPRLLTVAERSAFQETSRYQDVRAFVDALVSQTPRARVEIFGRSEEGRDLPLLVVGDPPVPSPPGAASSLPVVFVMANIHAGEVEGKEAVLHLARRMTLGDLQPLLRSAVWLFAPIYNADGNERGNLENRFEQNGPIGGVGTRENANGLDLNRDFMKLETSEARALVAVLTRWNPDVVIDLHTTNGSHHAYHLTYAPGLNPNTDSRIVGYARGRLLPTVRDQMERRHRFRSYYYGNFARAESIDTERDRLSDLEKGTRVWRTFDHRPRFGTNYMGLRNHIAVLSEAYSYLDFEGRVKVTEAFVEEIMRFVAANGSEVRNLVAAVNRSSSDGATTGAAGVSFELRPNPGPVEILAGTVETQVNPRSGKPMTAMVESSATPTVMVDYGTFAATRVRQMPPAYVVRPRADGLHQSIARLLEEHGVRVEELAEPARISVDQFVIDEVRHAEQAFQGHHETSVTGRFDRRDVDVPAGSIVVRTSQSLGRLVFYLLEPESDDGLTTWNLLEEALTAGGTHPVLKVRGGFPLPRTRPLPLLLDRDRR
ncbi:MAG TPA: M14 family metallopeptidase [Vicinamibacterales bacterium]|nr:M14 family metallopeptidase [Vicinamibacterales bacterium]